MTTYLTSERKQLHQRLTQLCGRPLLSEQADELRRLALILNVQLTWQRIYLNEGVKPKKKTKN